MRSLILAACAASIAVVSAPAFAWGKTGHRVVAAIADSELSGLSRAHIEEILGRGQSLADVANWPDEMRSAPGEFWQKTATPWHFVTLNGAVYDHAPPEGDALEALERFTKMLQDPGSSLADRQLALRFIVHLVGDLHQPLHVGKCCDKGGLEVKVNWFGKPSNLHTLWDSQLVDEEQLSFSELADKLERHMSSDDVIKWSDINPRDWIAESAKVRDSIYPAASTAGSADKGGAGVPDLGYAYAYSFTPVMERQLSHAGVRLAAYLNAIFAGARLNPAQARSARPDRQ